MSPTSSSSGSSSVATPSTARRACGGHFREEHQTADGEAKRNDDDFAYVSAWEFDGIGNAPRLHKEPLAFENVELATRSYK